MARARWAVLAAALAVGLSFTAACATPYSHIPLGNLMYRYSLQTGEDTWIVQHYDLLVFDNNNYNYLDQLKAAGGTTRMVWYQLWDTMGAGDTTRYNTLAQWCTQRGVDVETMFLHYSEPTTITINGTTYNVPSYSSANPKSASRAYGYIWGSLRWIFNVGNPNFQQFRAEKVYASVTTPPPGEVNVFDGIFADEAIDRKVARQGDDGVSSLSGGGIQEYSDMPGSWTLHCWDSAFAQSQWYADWVALAQAVRSYLDGRGLSAKITMLNAGNGWWTSTCEQGSKAAYRELWLIAGSWGCNSDSALGLIKSQSAAGVAQAIHFEGRTSAYPNDPDRVRLWALGTFYLTKSDYTYFTPEYDPTGGGYGGYMPNKWFGAIEYNVGTPTGDYYTFATGTDPVGQPYKVYARKFTQALVLVRVYQNSSYANFSDSTAVSVSLGGSYFKVRANGTLDTTASTTASLRNGEGAILASSGATESVTVTKSANKTNAAPGDTITYTITYSNQTSSTIYSAVVTDQLPSTVQFVAGSVKLNGSTLSPDPVASGKLSVSVGNLASAAGGTITFQVTVK